MSGRDSSSNPSLLESMNGLSLNGADKSAKTKAQLLAEMNELLVAKNYDAAIEMLPLLPNKERREYKAKIGQSKQLETEQVARSKKSEMELESKQKAAQASEAADIDMVGLFRETIAKLEHPILDRPEFFGPVEKRWISEQKGFGLVATRDVEPGELLIASKAFSIVFSAVEEDDSYEAKLQQANLLFKNTLAVVAYGGRAKELYGLFAGPGCYRCYSDNDPPPPRFDPLHVREILQRNAFGFSLKPSLTGDGPQGRGLWVLPSFINHSCAPNCTRMCYGDFMIIRAEKKISREEEFTLSYAGGGDVLHMFEERRARLKAVYGIDDCVCPLCECDKENRSKNPKLDARRAKLFRNFKDKSASLKILAPCQLKAFCRESIAQFDAVTYKNRHDNGLGLDAFWCGRSQNVRGRQSKASDDLHKYWSALTGEGSGNPGFVVAAALDLLQFCIYGLVCLHREGNAKGPDAIDLAEKLHKYAKIVFGAHQGLEMLLLMLPPDKQSEVVVALTRKLLNVS